MDNQLISSETVQALELLIQEMFTLNRIWDRGLSELDVKFTYKKFNETFHTGLAHKYPILADFFSDILLEYNISAKYYATPADITEYNNPIEFFERNLEEHKKAYKLIKEAIDIAVLNGDINVESELKAFMRKFNKYIGQAILLLDKANMYGENYALFDAFSEQFYQLEEDD